MLKNLRNNFRYDWPLHFIMLLTGWLPDNVLFLRLRGALAKHFLGSCGKNFRVGRNVVLYNPSEIHIGSNVYIAYGAWLAAGGAIRIEDEAMLGPYTVLASANHTRENGSFRYSDPERLVISIGRGSWIGAHATIMAGVAIGKGSLVASGAIVSRGNYPDDAFLAGVPAVFKKIITDRQI